MTGVQTCALPISGALGVTQKTAWFMLHRIRLAMKAGTFVKLSGQVEADETWIGPDTRKMHKRRLDAIRTARGMEDGKVSKAIVAGLLERAPKGSKRKSRVHAEVVQAVQTLDLIPPIAENVAAGSEMITDSLRTY